MTPVRCPRCATKRPDDLRWCRKCGLDFEAASKGVVPTSPGMPSRAAEPRWKQPEAAPRLDVRAVNDRKNMARMTRDALDIRCLGTLGGLVGAFLGFIVLGWIGMALGPAGALLAIIGLPLGWWLGVRTALGRLAK